MTRGGYVTPAAYVCRARKYDRRGEQRCTATILPVADVDARVWDAVARELDDPDLVSEIQRRAESRRANRRDWQTDADGYRARIARLTKTEAGVLARYRSGTISDGALDLELAALNRERSAFGVQLEAAERAVADRDSEAQDEPGAWLSALQRPRHDRFA